MVIPDTSLTADIDYKFWGSQDCLPVSSFAGGEGGSNRTQQSHFTRSYAFMIAN